MKKTIILTLTIISLLSCSSSDENLTNSIVGNWKITSHSDLSTLNDCIEQSTLNFGSNSDFTINFYEKNGDNCDRQISTGNYSETGTNEYTLQSDSFGSNENVTVIVNGNNLTMKSSNSTTTRTIGYQRQ
ncbi:hypothetical protein D6T69_06830 [Tenacibaculum singaporense]|uniref:Lipocalin-like domain-containing protein n=1 Tax=Tenacibaculum singaporense TaxID=2358479 RepID=A0A3Q8RRG6_9FLAO|nr:lipocalin family protein [Tenacibaculum singaporense]AZJ35248.1 hypothetical protein D6T69_06830 [Tenacibaculum singaporense]